MIPTWWLVLSLVFPRITLLLSYFGHTLPPHHGIPDWGSIILAVFLPRILVLIFIYQNMGIGLWFFVHAFVALCVWGGSGSRARRRRD
jgi:hypothetical protein